MCLETHARRFVLVRFERGAVVVEREPGVVLELDEDATRALELLFDLDGAVAERTDGSSRVRRALSVLREALLGDAVRAPTASDGGGRPLALIAHAEPTGWREREALGTCWVRGVLLRNESAGCALYCNHPVEAPRIASPSLPPPPEAVFLRARLGGVTATEGGSRPEARVEQVWFRGVPRRDASTLLTATRGLVELLRRTEARPGFAHLRVLAALSASARMRSVGCGPSEGGGARGA